MNTIAVTTFQDFETQRAIAGDPIRPIEEPAKAPNVAKKPRSLNPTRFLCRSEVRDFLLDYARQKRTHKFTRVSEETLTAINEQVRTLLIDRVRRLPSMGKTI